MRLVIWVIWTLIFAVPALAEPLIVEVPEGAKLSAISFFPADADRNASPIATLSEGREIDLPEGRYVYGFDGFPWRSTAFNHARQTTLELSALELTGSETADTRFTVHEVASAVLLGQLDALGVYALPVGAFELRRDLSEWHIDIGETRAGKVATIAMGGVSLSGALGPSEVVFLAPLDQDLVAGVLFGETTSINLPVGDYRARTSSLSAIQMISLAKGDDLVLNTRRLSTWRQAGADPFDIGDGSAWHPAAEGVFQTFLALNDIPISVRASGGDPIELPNLPETWIWRFAGGTLAPFDPLPVALFDQTTALPGGVLRVSIQLAWAADVLVELTQNETVVDQQRVSLSANRHVIDVPVPASLSSEAELEVRLTLGPAGSPLVGVVDSIPVHRFLDQPIRNLQVVDRSSTQIELAWDVSSEDGVVGYRVYRGSSDFPVSGRRPLDGGTFTDIALSARRDFHYRVCPVDEQGFDGPCAEVTAQTQ